MFRDNGSHMMMDDGLDPSYRRPEHQPPLGFEAASINRLETDREMFDVCNIVSEHLKQYSNLNLSLRQLLSLKLFNRYALAADRENVDTSDIFEEIDSLGNIESNLADPSNPLPTVGVELEVPITREVMRLRDVLSRFRIEHDDEQEILYEASPSYSYSPKVQAMILQELSKIGFVPMRSTEEEQQQYNSDNLSGYKINRDDPLSLHINLGLNCFSEYYQADKFHDVMEVLIYSLILAYTSSERIRSKKHRKAFDHNKTAKRSDKNECMAEYSLPIRLELKSAEFRDASSYRALFDAQHLGAALNSYIMVETGRKGSSALDIKLADIYRQFLRDANTLFERYQHNTGNIFESTEERQITAQRVEEGEIQTSFRSLSREYRSIIANTIKEETEG
jgi:hypothetical protein